MTHPATRRVFIKTAGIAGTGAVTGYSSLSASGAGWNDLTAAIPTPATKTVTITEINSNFEREPLIRPFGFKGGYMTEIWQTVNYLKSSSGEHRIGLCTQNVLWSDAQVFAAHSESGGNALMFALTERALQIIKGQSFTTPVELLDHILPEVYAYGQKITSNPQLRKTFALNALVGTDNAAWLLYAAENGIKNFDEMIPGKYKPALSNHHSQVAAIPLMAYSIPISEIQAEAIKLFCLHQRKPEKCLTVRCFGNNIPGR